MFVVQNHFITNMSFEGVQRKDDENLIQARLGWDGTYRHIQIVRYSNRTSSQDLPIRSGCLHVIWAFHDTSRSLRKHSHKGTTMLDLLEGSHCGANGDTQGHSHVTGPLSVHGIIMFLSWGVVLPLGTVLAK